VKFRDFTITTGDINMYEAEKDEVVQQFKLESEYDNLLINVMSYNKGKPKLQINREIIKKDRSTIFGKLGRLTLDEVKFIKDNIDNIIKVMEE
jgi:hypothetical protein